MKINIAKYILELLLEHEAISIPGLGQFKVEKKPASYGKGRKSLLPPTKAFVFKESHNPQDEVLKNYLAKNENISSDKADQFITKFTSDIMKGLMEKQPVELAYIGTLTRGGLMELVSFKQNEATVSKLNELLPEVVLPDPKSVADSPKMNIAVPDKQAEKVETSITNNSSQSLGSNPSYKESNGSGWWQWLVAALLLGAICILVFKMCKGEQPDVYKTIDPPTAVVVDEEGETSIPYIQDEDEQVVTGNQEGEMSNDDSNSVVSLSAEDCIVIVASMQNQKNVTRLVNRIDDKNYQSYTETHGAYTRVGVRIDCDEVRGSYKEFIRKVSKDFDVNAWSLKPEFLQ